MKKPLKFKYINKNHFKKFKYINRVFKVEKVYVRDHSSLSKTDTYYLQGWNFGETQRGVYEATHISLYGIICMESSEHIIVG